jgi:hypothetical protein
MLHVPEALAVFALQRSFQSVVCLHLYLQIMQPCEWAHFHHIRSSHHQHYESWYHGTVLLGFLVLSLWLDVQELQFLRCWLQACVCLRFSTVQATLILWEWKDVKAHILAPTERLHGADYCWKSSRVLGTRVRIWTFISATSSLENFTEIQCMNLCLPDPRYIHQGCYVIPWERGLCLLGCLEWCQQTP